MNLSTGIVWKILMKTLRKYHYKPQTVQSLTDQHKLCREVMQSAKSPDLSPMDDWFLVCLFS